MDWLPFLLKDGQLFCCLFAPSTVFPAPVRYTGGCPGGRNGGMTLARQTIYLDVLVALNLMLTWAMLRCTALLCHCHAGRGRIAAGSLAGGLAALVMLLPGLSTVVLMVVRLAVAGGIVLLAFGRQPRRMFARLTLTFFLVSVLFAGGMVALAALAAPPGLAVKNGTVYFHVSAVWLTAAAVAGCAAAKLFSWLFEKRMPVQLTERFIVRSCGREAAIRLLIDTGNRLTCFGKPVAVVSIQAVAGMLPDDLLACCSSLSAAARPGRWQGKLRMVPCRTAAGERLLTGIEAVLVRQRDGAAFDCVLALGEEAFGLDAGERVDGVVGPLD